MGLLDSIFRDLASTLCTTFGISVTLRRVTPGQYEPISGVQAPDVTEDFTTVASAPSQVIERYEGGVSIVASQMFILIPAKGLSFTPTLGDLVVIGQVVKKINLVLPRYSGDQVAAYEVRFET